MILSVRTEVIAYHLMFAAVPTGTKATYVKQVSTVYRVPILWSDGSVFRKQGSLGGQKTSPNPNPNSYPIPVRTPAPIPRRYQTLILSSFYPYP